MRVFVIGITGKRLMPTFPRKARKLLKEGRAKIYCKMPFTIKLLYKTGSTTQKLYRGVDTGSQHIGVSVVTTDDNGAADVLYKAEISLRSTMEKRSLLETRREYRRGRRYRKTRYRKPGFKKKTIRHYNPTADKKNRHWKKINNTFGTDRGKGWLVPSVRSKAEHRIKWIERYDDVLPSATKGIIEVGRFDIARMKDPAIHNELYQRGPMYDFENVKAYVFDRDHYKCKVCGAKGGTKRTDGSSVKLKAHHIDFKSKGSTDNPDRMATVCDKCHTVAAHKEGGVLYDWMISSKRFSRGYRDATLMNIMRKRLWQAFSDDSFTYGNITKADREKLHLDKSHANDAVAIALLGIDVNKLNDNADVIYIQQQRKKKRSLHEANARKGRKTPNRKAKRNRKNTKSVAVKERTYYLWDKVCINNRIGWISGFTGKAAYVRDENNEFITVSDKYKCINLSTLKVLGHNNNWITGPKVQLGRK